MNRNLEYGNTITFQSRKCSLVHKPYFRMLYFALTAKRGFWFWKRKLKKPVPASKSIQNSSKEMLSDLIRISYISLKIYVSICDPIQNLFNFFLFICFYDLTCSSEGRPICDPVKIVKWKSMSTSPNRYENHPTNLVMKV